MTLHLSPPLPPPCFSQVCTDIDECELEVNGGCHEQRECVNTEVCPVNELICLVQSHYVHLLYTIIINKCIGIQTRFQQKIILSLLPLPPLSLLLQGSFECGPCDEGYVERGSLDCIFSDPCIANQHDCARTEYCINHAIGEYYCECPIGMIGNGRECASDHDLDGIPNSLLTIGCDNPPCPVVSHVTSCYYYDRIT